MNKLLCLIFLIFFAIGITAQDNSFFDALSRMDRAIGNSQEEFTMRDNYYLGRTVAAHILSRYALYTEKPNQTHYLNLICKALAINSSSPNWYNGYFVMILDDSVPNAFSTPGGHIFITRGLLDNVTSEDMIAAVIAHELAHIQLKHSTSNINHDRLVRQLEQERNRISSGLGIESMQDIFSESISEIVDTMFGRGYSQLQEFEADSAALILLVSAGYNPSSYLDLLRIFERFSVSRAASLNNSHPSPALRIANLQRNMPIFWRTDTSSTRRDRFTRIMGRKDG